MSDFDFSIRQVDEQTYFGVVHDCTTNAIGDTIMTSVGEIDAAFKRIDGWMQGELIVHYEVLGDSRMRQQVGRPAIDLDGSDLPAGLFEFHWPAGAIASHLHRGSHMGIFQATV